MEGPIRDLPLNRTENHGKLKQHNRGFQYKSVAKMIGIDKSVCKEVLPREQTEDCRRTTSIICETP